MIIKNEFGKMPGPDIRPLLLKLQLFKSLLISFDLNFGIVNSFLLWADENAQIETNGDVW